MNTKTSNYIIFVLNCVGRIEAFKLKRRVLEWETEGRRRNGKPKKVDGVRRRMNNQGLTEEETRDRIK
jgi:hypothetical protein